MIFVWPTMLDDAHNQLYNLSQSIRSSADFQNLSLVKKFTTLFTTLIILIALPVVFQTNLGGSFEKAKAFQKNVLV